MDAEGHVGLGDTFTHTRFSRPVVLFDIDGTLVDSHYENALARYCAFRAVGLVIPVLKVHRHMGMGGDQLMAAVAGDDTERRTGDELRERGSECFAPRLDEVAAVDGACELLRAFADHGLQLVLASTGAAQHVEHYADLLGITRRCARLDHLRRRGAHRARPGFLEDARGR
jgi:beta-phosphoglucomutase-like phosphatase (HAD superfamily)